VKGDRNLRKQTLLRGSLVILLILILVRADIGHAPGRAANPDHTQYLPIVSYDDCVPGPILESDDPAKDQAVEAGINDIRAGFGFPILTHADKLTQAALRHSHDLAENDFEIGHTGSDGSETEQRIDEACYRWLTIGEIVAGGYDGEPDQVIEAWMNSPGHRYNILFYQFTEFGSGYAYKSRTTYKHYFTVNFGLPDPSSNVLSREYYACSYHLEDESGESWLNLHSVWPCDQLVKLQTGIDERR
jgi:uncharacterized protein YkwD